MKKLVVSGGCALLITSLATQSLAHFGMVIPSANIATQDAKEVKLTLSFSHPFEQIGMDLDRPRAFFMKANGEETDLLPLLKEEKVMGHNGWSATHRFKRPGVYQFAMEPQPYWEPAEDVSIIHYTKTFVAAYGEDQGWDEPLGMPAEIVPLLRPFGNYAGNSFTGKVLLDGKAVPGAEIEVEYYNESGEFIAPDDYHITQVIKADDSGIFHFTCPQPGWWGFAALSEADYTLPNPQGEEKGVEIGAVLWTYMNEYTKK